MTLQQKLNLEGKNFSPWIVGNLRKFWLFPVCWKNSQIWNSDHQRPAVAVVSFSCKIAPERKLGLQWEAFGDLIEEKTPEKFHSGRPCQCCRRERFAENGFLGKQIMKIHPEQNLNYTNYETSTESKILKVKPWVRAGHRSCPSVGIVGGAGEKLNMLLV